MRTAVPTHFKDTPTQGLYRASQIDGSSFRGSMSDVLKAVCQGMLDASLPMTKSANFTLVNLFIPESDLSLGYSTSPPEEVIFPNSSLVLTFSMAPRPRKTLPQEFEMLTGRSRMSRLWGSSPSPEYLTISLTRTNLANTFINLETATVLYNAIGLVSKNFAEHGSANTFRAKTYLRTDISYEKDRKLTSTPLRMFSDSPLDEWPYSKVFWSKYSHLFMPELMHKDFPLYYVLYLDESVYRGDLADVALDYQDNDVRDYVLKGLSQISGNINSTVYETGPNVQAALYLLLYQEMDCSMLHGREVDRKLFVQSFFGKLTEKMQAVPEFQSKIVSLVNQSHSSMANSMVSGSYNANLRNLSTYLSLAVE